MALTPEFVTEKLDQSARKLRRLRELNSLWQNGVTPPLTLNLQDLKAEAETLIGEVLALMTELNDAI